LYSAKQKSRNECHGGMKNKKHGVIGREGSVTIVRVKRSDNSVVGGRDSAREKKCPCLSHRSQS